MVRCFIALGSNLHNPLQQVNQAVAAVGRLPQSELVDVSPWFQSKAVGPGEQPDYINGVLALDTHLEPEPLLASLQAIEADSGRVRSERWGARTLDLDLLLYGDLTLQTPSLTIPHPRIAERQFVMLPLLSVAPDLVLPDGRRVALLSEQLGEQAVSLVDAATSPTMSGIASTRDGGNGSAEGAGDKTVLTTKITAGDPE